VNYLTALFESFFQIEGGQFNVHSDQLSQDYSGLPRNAATTVNSIPLTNHGGSQPSIPKKLDHYLF
jgi:hypothetical protein